MSDLIGKKLEGNLALNKPIAFNQTIMTTGGNFHFTVNPMLIIVHIALFFSVHGLQQGKSKYIWVVNFFLSHQLRLTGHLPLAI